MNQLFAARLRPLLHDDDLVGFQTGSDADCLRAAVAEVLGDTAVPSDDRILHSAGSTHAGVFPIGADVAAIRHEAGHSQTSETVKRMSAGLPGRRCLIGVGRLDGSKSLVERFLAYERNIEVHPESLNRTLSCRSRQPTPSVDDAEGRALRAARPSAWCAAA